MASLDKSRKHIAEEIRFLKDAGVNFLALETFFQLAEVRLRSNVLQTSGCRIS
jgi:biotin operon repressor